MIDLVLATDMKQHFALISQFKAAHAACCDQGTLGGKCNSAASCSTGNLVNSASEFFKPVPIDETERILALQARQTCLSARFSL
jgi:hypothetical protein